MHPAEGRVELSGQLMWLTILHSVIEEVQELRVEIVVVHQEHRDSVLSPQLSQLHQHDDLPGR